MDVQLILNRPIQHLRNAASRSNEMKPIQSTMWEHGGNYVDIGRT